MTKRNMLLSLASGKLGDMVFYRAGGEQRTRTRVVPRNPKSIAQMESRIPMANLSALYKGWAAVLRSSFSSKKANESAFNVFVRENKPANNFYVPRNTLKTDKVYHSVWLYLRALVTSFAATYCHP